jgi:hypothetical protein
VHLQTEGARVRRRIDLMDTFLSMIYDLSKHRRPETMRASSIGSRLIDRGNLGSETGTLLVERP